MLYQNGLVAPWNVRDGGVNGRSRAAGGGRIAPPISGVVGPRTGAALTVYVEDGVVPRDKVDLDIGLAF